MKLLTFLGITKYDPVIYFDDKLRWETKFFQEFAARRHRPDEIVVFLTAEAREKNWGELQPLLESLARVHPVDIPSGKSEDELWELFDIVVEQFAERETAILDVTNAWRSLPILNLLMAAFVRVVKEVEITHILYGAFEAKNEARETPVFDLKPFLTLLDWTTAAKTFISTGDARQLGGLAEDHHRWLWRNVSDKEQLPKKLSSLGRQLASISESFETIRPDEFIKSVAGMHELIDKVEPEAHRWLKPLSQLLHRIQGVFAPFRKPQWSLAAERDLAGWYFDNGHVAQAIALIREWLVSWVMRTAGQSTEKLCDQEEREKAGKFLGSIAAQLRSPNERNSFHMDPEFDFPGISTRTEKLAKLYDMISGIRNDVMHCGKREHPKPPKTILKLCEDGLAQIRELPLPPED